MTQAKFQSYNAPMEAILSTLPDNSVDIILTDPPYLYLKNQKLDKAFDEQLLFTQARRVLKDKGFIVMFGRGTSFYRWNTMQAVNFGLSEKSIISQRRDHYSTIHPTQKPVRLLERLIALVKPKDIEAPVVLDPFAGSFSTGIAAVNMGCYPVLIERDKEYYEGGKERIINHINELQK